MKYVINVNWGGFSVPEEVKPAYNAYWNGSDDYEPRTDEALINWVLAHKNETGLKVVEIPDEATDWELNEYDGWESIIAVVNGKLIHIG